MVVNERIDDFNAKIDVSTDRGQSVDGGDGKTQERRLQRLCKERQTNLAACRLCWLKEEKGVETTPDFRAVLSRSPIPGCFVEQGNTKYSG